MLTKFYVFILSLPVKKMLKTEFTYKGYKNQF